MLKRAFGVFCGDRTSPPRESPSSVCAISISLRKHSPPSRDHRGLSSTLAVKVESPLPAGASSQAPEVQLPELDAQGIQARVSIGERALGWRTELPSWARLALVVSQGHTHTHTERSQNPTTILSLKGGLLPIFCLHKVYYPARHIFPSLGPASWKLPPSLHAPCSHTGLTGSLSSETRLWTSSPRTTSPQVFPDQHDHSRAWDDML